MDDCPSVSLRFFANKCLSLSLVRSLPVDRNTSCNYQMNSVPLKNLWIKMKQWEKIQRSSIVKLYFIMFVNYILLFENCFVCVHVWPTITLIWSLQMCSRLLLLYVLTREKQEKDHLLSFFNTLLQLLRLNMWHVWIIYETNIARWKSRDIVSCHTF